jgi:UPF0176 protein
MKILLHNRVDKRVLRQRIQKDSRPRTTISFYKYWPIPDPAAFRDELYAAWFPMGVLGRVYVANEGINAQISVPDDHLDQFREHLFSYDFLKGIRLNYAVDDNGKSFFKLKILVRQKIVADGLNDSSFNPSDTGKHLNAEQFNEVTNRPDTLLVDMRNHYESEVGHFKGAILPDVDSFREELEQVTGMLEPHKDKHIVMYCTGGIRCEKASAWLKHNGFPNVYQLEGGIIEYARQVKAQGLENKFIGKNFVFDERMVERISDDVIAHCHQCGEPFDVHTNCANAACHLLFIQCDKCKEDFKGCCSAACKEIVELPEEEQKALRKGLFAGRKVFHKGRTSHLPCGQ